MNSQKIVFRFHALRRMFERKIMEHEVLEILMNGKTIEDYPADQPYPSRLLLGAFSGRPLHAVVANAVDTGELIVITVYEPNLEVWKPGFEIRRIP